MMDTISPQSTVSKEDIFDYQRFGDFLRARIESKPESGRSLSYRGLAKKLQGVSAQMLHAIAHGKRLPGQGVLHDLCQALGLSYTQEQFAELLVAHERAETPAEKEHFAAKLHHFHRDYTGLALTEDRAAFLTNTRHVAIFEMLDLEDFQSDPEWISRRLLIPTTPDEVQRILKFLETIGLVKWENGVLKKSASELNVIDEISEATILGFHRDMLRVAGDALEAQTVDERGVYGVTMCIDSDKIMEARRLIAKFSMEMAALLNVSPKKEVYHLGVQLFRVSKKTD